MPPSSVTTRDFKRGDLPQVVELYNCASIKNPHFVRNGAFLNHFMNYPNANKDGAFVTEVDGKITGFVAVSVTMEQGGLKQGNIIEFHVKDATSAHALLQVAVEYCKLRDVDSIILVAPPLVETKEVLNDWLKFDTGVMMAKILSPVPLLKAWLSSERTRNLYAGKKVSFHIGADVVNVEITPKEINVFQTDGKQDKAVAQVFMSPEVFLRILLGQLNPYVAYLNGKVKVRGAKNTLSILRLLYLIKVDAPFFTSLADRM